MENRLLLYIVLLIQFPASAQQYANDIEFVIHQVEKNYPAYASAINQPEYMRLINRVRNSKSTDTLKLLSIITLYFNDKHLVVYDLKGFKQADSAACSKNLEWVRASLDDPLKKKSRYEGYWLSEFNNCIMAIKQAPEDTGMLKGYVVAAASNVRPGTVIAEMEQVSANSLLMGFTDIDFGYRMFVYANLDKNNVLQVSSYNRWRKMKAFHEDSAKKLTRFDYTASLKIHDSNTIVIRIPENNEVNTRIVDSLVRRYHAALVKTKNLIIDVRNNIGGTVRTYYPLLPYIATQPIIRPADSMFCSEEYIAFRKQRLTGRRMRADTQNIWKQEKILERALAHRNRYIFIPGDTMRFDSVSRYPENVAIITNYASLSAAELMLLDCKQSSKVTTFGEATGGAVDYPDFFPLATPSKKFVLFIPGTKRALLKDDRLLDASGISPDVPIPDTVPDWIDFIISWYEKYK